MKFTAKRLLGAGVVGIAAIVTPLSLTVLSGGPTAVAAPSSGANCPQNSGADEICFVQTSGSSGSFFVYQAAASGAKAVTQSLTGGGGCASPSVSGTPMLPFSAYVYSNNTSGNPYSSTKPNPANAIVTADKQRTGVCGVNGSGTQPWSIENVPGAAGGGEALDFSVGGAGSAEGTNRLFASATIDIGNNSSTPTTVTLVETLAGNPVGSQSCPVAAAGTLLTSTLGGPCSTAAPYSVPNGPFDTVEVQVATVGNGVSVIGPSSIFTLASHICGGGQISTPAASDTLNNPGGVTATLTLTGASTQCKTYTSFTSVPDSSDNNLPTLSFNGLSTGTVQFTIQVTWPAVPLCNPYVDIPGQAGATTGIPNDPGLAQTMCPVHQFMFNGTGFYDQAYCQSAQAPIADGGSAVGPQQELCTVTKSYNNDTVSYTNGTACPAPATPCMPVTTPIYLSGTQTPGTQIVETWVGDVDMRLH